MTPYHEAITQALKVDAHRPKQERRTARALHAEIKAMGYAGGYTRVTDFIREWRQGEGQGVLTKAFVPLSFELGEAFQFDWSEEGLGDLTEYCSFKYIRVTIQALPLWSGSWHEPRQSWALVPG